MDEKSDVKDYLALNALWSNTPKDVVADNIDAVFAVHVEKKQSRYNCRTKVLCAVTGSTRHAVIAWFNRSRDTVKIPFLKICMIADALEIPVEYLFSKDLNWLDDTVKDHVENNITNLMKRCADD